jgi:hypothetical protein
MDEQSPQVAVAALANAAQLVDAACGILSWHKTEPGGEMSAGFEVGGVSHGSNERGRCDQANARDRHDPSASIDLTGNKSQILLNLDELSLDLPELFDQTPQTAS